MEFYNISGLSSTEMETQDDDSEDGSSRTQEKRQNQPAVTETETKSPVIVENRHTNKQEEQNQHVNRLNTINVEHPNSNTINGIKIEALKEYQDNKESEMQTKRELWIKMDRERVKTIKRQDEEIRELKKKLTELEKRCNAVEKEVKQFVETKEERVQFRTSVSENSLETRMAALEATLGNAVNYMFPRMDEVLSRIEEASGGNFSSLSSTYPPSSSRTLSSSTSAFLSGTQNTSVSVVPKEEEINLHFSRSNKSNTSVSFPSTTSIPSSIPTSPRPPHADANLGITNTTKDYISDTATQPASINTFLNSTSSQKPFSASIILDPTLLDATKHKEETNYFSSRKSNQMRSSSPTVSFELSSSSDLEISNVKLEDGNESEGESDLEVYSSSEHPRTPSLIPPVSPHTGLSTPPPSPPVRPLPADLDAALRDAAKDGNTDEVCRLLLSGAEADGSDNLRTTALHWAAIKGHLQVASALLEADAMVDSRDVSGWTPLHFASSKGHASVVSFLLRRGASVISADDKQWTPLHVAVHGGHVDCVQLLLAAGADAFASDLMGKKMLDLSDSEPVRKILLKAMK